MSTSSSLVDSPKQGGSSPSSNPFSHFLGSISSYDGNVMLAALISLLLVILFVLLLHLYARWFLAQARQRRRPTSISVTHVLRTDRFRHFHAFNFDLSFSTSPSKGLDSAVISSIPLFVYKSEESKHGLECVICLSSFEDKDVGRQLPKCGHGFHVQCIDMWLQSHSNCPICRAPLATESRFSTEVSSLEETTGESPAMDAIINEESGQEDDTSSSSPSSSSSVLSSSLGCSLKRMLSRNRSEHKVFPTSNATDEVDV
ncbi:hypothetical protein SLEP1_g20025 [Rubroshorea leprosula]|uniref:RING-type E3 ubiquitin transferase n=1 Tax=Rubroshorea leprosula TaxID=152421 RepID=A0AAV5J1B1_9ROSI|nr:hypothetical protein SLEP1_g20025 [Rubroshorea leprosula]